MIIQKISQISKMILIQHCQWLTSGIYKIQSGQMSVTSDWLGYFIIHFSLPSVISLKFQCYGVMWHKITISDHYKSEKLDGLYICMCRRMGPTLVTCSRLELWKAYLSSVCCGIKTVPLFECGRMMIRDQTTQFGHGFAIIFVPPSSGFSSFLLLLLGKPSHYKSLSAKSVAMLLMTMPLYFLAFHLFLFYYYLFLNLLEIDLHSVAIM